jgi:hypothetical protein
LAKRAFLGYETKHHPVLSRREFALRLARSFGVALALIVLSLLIGMCGYHFFEDLPWIDAFLNASMILGGMGPVDPLKTGTGKLFAGLYALYSGFVVLVSAAVMFAPLVHRMLHTFHAEADESK